MMYPEPAADAPALLDKALNLRESLNSSKARMFAQREQITRLRAELSAMRALAANRTAVPARSAARVLSAPPAARPAAAPRPVLKETAVDSAPAAISLSTALPRFGRLAPYAAILAVAVAVQLRPAPRREALPLTSVVPLAPSPSRIAPALEDDGAAEALLLVNEYRLPGDERTLSERLGGENAPPGARPAWTAERTGERAYRVSFRAPNDGAGYDFDVDLDSGRVDPTPETAELIAPRLTARR